MLSFILKGALISASLIIAIGAQNIFVIKQAIRRNHIFWVALTCSLCDLTLITISVLGIGTFISKKPLIAFIFALLGTIFVITYGFLAFKKAFLISNQTIQEETTSPQKRRHIILATLAVTLLNPHLYLDTFVILAGITAKLSFNEKIYFLIGSVSASFIWFFGIGYGIRLLTPYFKKAITWRILEGIVGLIMCFIAIGFIRYMITLAPQILIT